MDLLASPINPLLRIVDVAKIDTVTQGDLAHLCLGTEDSGNPPKGGQRLRRTHLV